MSTRAAIGFALAEGGYTTIYSHYDGYPEHVGKILKQFHNSDSAARRIVGGSHIHHFDHDGVIARFGEGDAGGENSQDMLEAICGYDYLYLWDFDQQKWRCFARDGYIKPTSLREVEL